jgi:hypothetical protein
MDSDTSKFDQFLEDNYPLIRVLIGVLGIVFIITSPLVWGGVGWAVGFAFVLTGIRLLLLAVQGGR